MSKGIDSPVFRFNKQDDSLETISITPTKVNDSNTSTGFSSSKKSSFKDNFRSHSVDDVGTSSESVQSTKTWRMIKDKVAQAVEDYKSNKSVKDDDSDLDDISESSVKTENLPNNTEDTPSLIGKSLTSLRKKKRAVFSKLAKGKEGSPARTNTRSKEQDLKAQIDIESGVEVSEDMVLVPFPTQNDEELFITPIENRDLPLPIASKTISFDLPEHNNSRIKNDNMQKLIELCLSLVTKESFLFALLAVVVTLVLKLSQFWQGAFTTGFFILLYRNVCDSLKQSVLRKSLPSLTFQLNNKSTYEGIEVHRPIKMYRGWMNLTEKYDPENYHVSQTQSVHVKIDGSSLRVSFTKSKISKRHLWNESAKSRSARNFTHHKFFELTGATIELYPRGLARKRYFSRKYPIRITFVPRQGTEKAKKDAVEDEYDVELIENKKIFVVDPQEDLLDFKDCSDVEFDVLYLFARCDREKEDWFRQFKAASIGDIHDCSDEPNVKSKESSKSNSLNTTPTKEVFRDAAGELIKRDSSASGSKDGEGDFERIEKDFAPLETLISPCASRSSPDFVQFIKAYLRKGIEKKSLENEWWTGYDFFQPLSPDVYWINLVIGRFLYGVIHDSSILDEIHAFFQRKLSAIKLPNFMEEVSINEINLASNTPPIVHKIYPPYFDERGIWIDADVTYEGGLVHATISTKLNLMRLKKQESSACESAEAKLYSKSAPVETIYDSEAESETSSDSDEDTSSIATDVNIETLNVSNPTPAKKKRLLRIVNKITTSNLFQSATEIRYIQRAMENMSTNIKLRVELKGLISRVVINLPSPHSDRLWLGFREPPRLFISAKPTIGDSLFDYSLITSAIENKLCDEIYKQMVYPNLIDVIIPTLGQPTYKE